MVVEVLVVVELLVLVELLVVVELLVLVELLVVVLVVVGVGHVQSLPQGNAKAPHGLPGGSQVSPGSITLLPHAHWQSGLQRNAPLVLVHGLPGGSHPSPGSTMPLPHGAGWAGVWRTTTNPTAAAASITRPCSATRLTCVLDIPRPP